MYLWCWYCGIARFTISDRERHDGCEIRIADIVKGEMNKSSKIFITELGKQHNKTTVSEVESTIVNLITKTPVRGYEIFAKDITMTKNGYYRVWIGLRLPMGDYNKMYNFTIAEAVDAYNVKSKAKIAFEKLESHQMKIVIYSKNNCQFCTKAKHLVKTLGLEYEEKSLEKDFGSDPVKLVEDIGKQVRTMPQIKIDDKLVGGYNQLIEYFADKGLVNFKGEIIDKK